MTRSTPTQGPPLKADDMTPASPGFMLSARAHRTGAQPISFLMAEAVQNPSLISLAAGLVDYPTLPTEDAAAMLTRILEENGDTPTSAPTSAGPVESSVPAPCKTAMQYGTTHGHAELRQALLEHMARLDGVTPDQLNATADDVVITTGSQQLLFMLTDVMIDPGDIVITGWPSYFVYTGTLKTFGAQVRTVDLDEHGMVPEKLDALLTDLASQGLLPRVKIVYVVDYHQNPTGLTVSAERRPQLLDIVKKHSKDQRILLLEDAAYRELTYEGEPPHSIKRYDTSNEYVALTQTFSKPFAPGLKTGYGLLPSDLVEPVVNQKGNHDFGSANLCQHLLLRAMREGAYQRQVDRLKERYRTKLAAMLRAMDEQLGDLPGVSWTRPTGGLYVYLTLPESLDTRQGGELFQRAVAEGVLYVPGDYGYPDDATREKPHHHMRLSFGVPSIPQIQEGIARLARTVKAMM